MAFRTITARFPGACRRCAGTIEIGERIRFGGRGLIYHLSADCPDAGTFTGNSERVTTVYFPSTGETIHRNVNGRCEDAPCCGCCSY